MKRLLPVVFAGTLAVSFSPLAFSQSAGVQGPAGTGASVDLGKDTLPDANTNVQNSQQVGDQNQANQQQGDRNQAQNTQQSSDRNAGAGASGESDDKNPDSPGKGWAKGHERGKGHGANDERHGGRHSGAGGSSDYDRQSSEQSGAGGNQSIQQQGERNQGQNAQQSGGDNQNAQTGSGSSSQEQERRRY
jgi:hypothetical protein